MTVARVGVEDVPVRVFEGILSSKDLAVTPELLAGLRRIGYDRAAPLRAYPVEVWRDALEVIRQSALPQLEAAAGLRELGRRFAEGFGRTPVGWVFRAVAPVFGIDRTLLVLPRYLHTVRRNMHVTVNAEGTNSYRLTARDPKPSPEFIAGCLQGILDIFTLAGRIEIVSADERGFELLIRW